jgi:hypothetical protein
MLRRDLFPEQKSGRLPLVPGFGQGYIWLQLSTQGIFFVLEIYKVNPSGKSFRQIQQELMDFYCFHDIWWLNVIMKRKKE